MTLLHRSIIMLLFAGIAGVAGIPVLAIIFAVAGLLLLDVTLISSVLRLISSFRR